jgi:uncharacterized membrane protein
MIAALRETGYNFVLFLHVLTVIISMAGAIGHPLLFALEEKRSDGDVVALMKRVETPGRIYSIAYALTGLIGFGLVSMGDWGWGETWIWLSILLWVASNALLHAAMLPAERAVAAGDVSAMAKINKIGPPLTLMILAVIFLMTVKPGASNLGGF